MCLVLHLIYYYLTNYLNSKLQIAREIKILSIYLALGCPERIRFEYEFVTSPMTNLPKSTSSSVSNPYSGLLGVYSSDPDGDGLSNGLRRLLHLNASDYLLHRDWVVSTFSVYYYYYSILMFFFKMELLGFV